MYKENYQSHLHQSHSDLEQSETDVNETDYEKNVRLGTLPTYKSHQSSSVKKSLSTASITKTTASVCFNKVNVDTDTGSSFGNTSSLTTIESPSELDTNSPTIEMDLTAMLSNKYKDQCENGYWIEDKIKLESILGKYPKSKMLQLWLENMDQSIAFLKCHCGRDSCKLYYGKNDEVLCLNNSKTNKLRCPNTINKLNKNCVFKTCRDCFEFEELNINNNKKLKCNSTVEIDMEEDI